VSVYSNFLPLVMIHRGFSVYPTVLVNVSSAFRICRNPMKEVKIETRNNESPSPQICLMSGCPVQVRPEASVKLGAVSPGGEVSGRSPFARLWQERFPSRTIHLV
jgi:hypothetical protein